MGEPVHIGARGHMTTHLEDFETRPLVHQYVISRPKAIRYYHESNLVEPEARSNSVELGHSSINLQYSGSEQHNHSQHVGRPPTKQAEAALKQRRHLDLFVDLIFVGIISNIAEEYSSSVFEEASDPQSAGYALLEFLVLFLPTWRIWNDLRVFCDSFYQATLTQNIFISWILILALLYGNNAPYFSGASKHDSNFVIYVYMTSRASFYVVESVYSLYIQGLRKQLFIKSLLSIPWLALWIGALFVKWPVKAGLILPATALEGSMATFLQSELFDRILTHHYRKALDRDQFIERIEAYFMLILGDGVFNLVKNSPLGPGISSRAGSGMLGLCMFYVLHVLYFNGDQSKRFIHAVRRTWWRTSVWSMLHVFMFGSVLLFGTAVVFLVTASQSADEPDPDFVHRACWTLVSTLSVALGCFCGIALLNKSLDGPKTLLVNNRALRMSPRLIIIVVLLCLPIKGHWNAVVLLGVVLALLYSLMIVEFLTGLSHNAALLEPKDLEHGAN